MRYAARTDANKGEIVEALKAAGHEVFDLRIPVDLMVGVTRADGVGVTLLVEIKDGRKPPSGRRHTDLQARFIASWPGPVATVMDVEGALRAAEAVK